MARTHLQIQLKSLYFLKIGAFLIQLVAALN